MAKYTSQPRHRSQHLVNEPPIPLYPSLAVALDGSDRALILQQLNYWLTHSNNYRDGRFWVYNTYAEWHAQFPWMSVSSIRRALLYLEEQGLVLTANHNRQKTDRTKWYTIDDDAVGLLLRTLEPFIANNASAQNEQWAVQSEQMEDAKVDRSVPETTQQTTPEDMTDDFYTKLVGAGLPSAIRLELKQRYTRRGVLDRDGYRQAALAMRQGR